MDSGSSGMGMGKHRKAGHPHVPGRTKQAVARIVNQLQRRPERPTEMAESMDELLNRPKPKRRKGRRRK